LLKIRYVIGFTHFALYSGSEYGHYIANIVERWTLKRGVIDETNRK